MLLAAFMLSAFATVIGVIAAVGGSTAMAAAARRAHSAATVAVLAALAVLAGAFLTHDFSLAYVAEHSDRSTPWPLLVSGVYAGQEGSLLYWVLVLMLISAGCLWAGRAAGPRLGGWASALMSGFAGYLLFVLLFVSSPFDILRVVPRDGLGLNPLLRDSGMLIHPPFLLAGFSAFAVPFFLLAAGLLAGRDDPRWTALVNRSALLAWALQSVGLTLGMWWAYHVLGWGGYWGWDPVENAALLPWLAATAFVHTSRATAARGVLRPWNAILLALAFALSLFGTYVTRSGLIQSVHSFAASSIGGWFLAPLAVTVLGSMVLIAWRYPRLRSSRPVTALVSREGGFLVTGWLLVAAVVVVVWGMLLPLISSLAGGGTQVVPAAYYERALLPILLVVLALMPAGVLLSWNGPGELAAATRWRPRLMISAGLAGVGIGVALLLYSGATWSLAAGFVFGAGLVVIGWSASRLLRRVGDRQPDSWIAVAARRRRAFGAQVVHLAILVVALAMVVSHVGQVKREVVLRPGQSVDVAGHHLVYLQGGNATVADGIRFTARIQDGGTELTPARTAHPRIGQATTQVAIRSDLSGDLYLVLIGAGPGDQIALDVFFNPMVPWIWAGATVLVFGLLVIAAPLGRVWRPGPEPESEAEPVTETLPLPAGAAR